MSEVVKTKVSKKQAKELIQQFQQNPHFDNFSKPEHEYYTFADKKGGTIITIYKFDKKYYLEIFSGS